METTSSSATRAADISPQLRPLQSALPTSPATLAPATDEEENHQAERCRQPEQGMPVQCFRNHRRQRQPKSTSDSQRGAHCGCCAAQPGWREFVTHDADTQGDHTCGKPVKGPSDDQRHQAETECPTADPTTSRARLISSIRRACRMSPSRPTVGVATVPASKVAVPAHVVSPAEPDRTSGSRGSKGITRECIKETTMPAKASTTMILPGPLKRATSGIPRWAPGNI